VPPSFAEKARIGSTDKYRALYDRSISDPDRFWAEQADRITWFKRWDKVSRWDFNKAEIEWFIGGKTNVAYNCLDRHVEEGRGEQWCARRLLARPRTPPLTPAQAETLAIIAYLQPVSRPEIARIRGVGAESAAATLLERGLIEESGRSQFGAVLYRTTELFLRLFGLNSLDGLPPVDEFDPAPELEAELRERLLRAGEARAGSA